MPTKAYLKSPGYVLAKDAIGNLCLVVLRLLRVLPPGLLDVSFRWALPVYTWIRFGQAGRLRSCFSATPFSAQLTIRSYYRMRLRLYLHGIHQFGKKIAAGSVTVSGEMYYHQALETGRPVALLGLHAGMLELLHRVPRAPNNRPFMILTARAFADSISKFMAEGRQKDGKEVVWIDSDKNKPGALGRNLTSSLRILLNHSGVLALMADQNPKPKSGRDTLLLWNSISIAFPARLLEFLAGKGFLFVPVSTCIETEGISSLIYHPVWDPEAWEPIGRETDDFIAGSLVQNNLRTNLRYFLESSISKAPEQWNWSYPKVQALNA